MANVADVAAFLRRSNKTVYRLLKLRDPVSGEPLLPAQRILGEILVLARDVLRLPAAYPDWAPKRPPLSFFSEEVRCD